MNPRTASRLHSDCGQTSAEYIGLILVVVAIISAIAASGIGATIGQGIENAICSVGARSCEQREEPRAGAVAPGAGTPAPGARDGVDPGPQRGAPTDRGPDGRSGSAGERPRASEGTGPGAEGGGPSSEPPASGVELADGATAPEPFDPPAPDEGSGAHGSESAGIADRVNKEKWYAAADAAEALGHTDAARHLRHYLDNSGTPLQIDVASVLHDEAGLREAVGNQVDLASRAALASYAGSGPADIPIRTSWRVFTASGKNWFYGLGSMSHSITGVVQVEPGDPPQTTVTYRVHVHDRYNWDGNKSTEIGPITVEDKELQALHRKGLAQEYDVDGTSDEITVTVDPDDAGSTQPPAGDGRDGSRGDPGRSRG